MHTPTPWFIGSFENTAIVTGHSGGMVLYRGKPEFTEDDAAFIVRACNAHDDLLEAVRAAKKIIESDQTSFKDEIRSDAIAALTMANQAIAKAEEK